MSQPLPELFDAPDDAAHRATLAERFRGLPSDIVACAAAVARDGRLPSPVVTSAARAEVGALDRAAPATLREELTRALVGRNVHVALQWLHDVGAMAKLLPEIEATVDFSQESGRKHKDVWEHTKQVVRQAIPDPAVRWAALLHDIGKVPTRTFTPDGGVHFHGHAEVGARMFDPIARRLAFDRAAKQKVRFLILHHLRANQYAPSWTDSAVRRFDREMGEHLDDLLALSRAAAADQPAADAHPRPARARRQAAAAADGPRHVDRRAVRHPAVAADRRPQAGARGGLRARRARGAPRGRLLPRLAGEERPRRRRAEGRVAP
jgi:poly(A) polymerase